MKSVADEGLYPEARATIERLGGIVWLSDPQLGSDEACVLVDGPVFSELFDLAKRAIVLLRDAGMDLTDID